MDLPPRDWWREVAAQVYGKPYEQVTEQERASCKDAGWLFMCGSEHPDVVELARLVRKILQMRAAREAELSGRNGRV